MNKRMKQMISQAVIGTTLAAMAAIGVGQVASASGTTGTCVTTGLFTASGTCTVLAGEVINFVLKGGDGGAGGVGGAGGNGGPSIVPFVPGGIGGSGGLMGVQGAGARIIGSYVNSTDATVTLTFDIGVKGSDGTAGVDGVPGGERGAGGAGGTGTDGTDGGNGTAGTESVLRIDSSLIASAQGGTNSTGGKGGKGGTGATTETAGTNGAPGETGSRGFNGSYAPVPLPESWMYTDTDLSDPRVDFFVGEEHEELTTTTVPETTVLLPETGSNTGPSILVTLLVLASGVAFVVLARRRVVS